MYSYQFGAKFGGGTKRYVREREWRRDSRVEVTEEERLWLWDIEF